MERNPVMSMRLIVVAVAAALVLGGCGGGDGGYGESIAYSASGVAVPFFNGVVTSFGGIVYFLASEKDQAGADLNADGDPADNVVHALDPSTGTVTNLGVAAASPPVTVGSFIAWFVSETGQGTADFSGDGDFGDYVLVVFDPSLPVSPTNPSITATVGAFNTPVWSDGDRAVFLTAELDVGADLAGDGDLLDTVIRTRDLGSGVVTNTAQVFDLGAFAISVANGTIAFAVSEMDTGMMGTDLSADGDASDLVLFAHDITSGVTSPVGGGTPAEIAANVLVTGSPTTPVVMYARDEMSTGMSGTNFNSAFSDADAEDFVLAIWDVVAGTETFPLGGLAVDPFQFAGSDTRAAFVASEEANGGVQDFNGDGDAMDEVPYWLDLNTSLFLATNIGMATVPGAAQIQICDLYIVFVADEISQGPLGTNLNALSGDADTDDAVAHWLDITAPGNAIVNTGFATSAVLCFDGDNVLFLTSDEAAQGPSDLNGDGDQSDIVPIYFRVDVANQALIQGVSSIIIDGPVAFQVCPTQIRIFGNSSESNLNEDFNEDGDMDDYALVASRIRRVDGEIQSFAVIHSTDRDGTAFPVVIDTDTVVFPFAEDMAGIGLNLNSASGDSDVSDTILMVANPNCF